MQVVGYVLFRMCALRKCIKKDEVHVTVYFFNVKYHNFSSTPSIQIDKYETYSVDIKLKKFEIRKHLKSGHFEGRN